VLSTLHQSGLGALFLFSKPKLHPLWYTEFLPVLFLVSSVFAGLSMIIFEGTISHRVFKDQIDPAKHASFEDIVFGLSKGAAVAMYVYLFVKFVIFVHGQHWNHLATGWGALYIFEVVGMVLIPCALFTHGYRQRRIGMVRTAAVLTLIGIILNRLNVSVIAFNWQAPHHYYPSIGEIVVTLMVIFTEIWVFRWVVYRMPVLRETTEGNRK
jgi:Ni/Fe-hydrogenase subunit HybB-like protein